MKFKEMKSDEELENYRHAIHSHIDVLFPLEYLKQGRVYGLYNEKGELFGGFALITEGPFRVLQSIPEFNGLDFDQHQKETAEITGLWLSNTKREKNISLRFWLFLIRKILTSEKKYFVYAYSSHKTHLEKIYSRTDPIILFRGHTILLPGMDQPEHESVEVLVRKRLFLQALKNPDFFIKRYYPALNLSAQMKALLLKDNYEISNAPLYAFLSVASKLSRREPKINR